MVWTRRYALRSYIRSALSIMPLAAYLAPAVVIRILGRIAQGLDCAADGGGRAETTGIAGTLVHEMAASTGERPIKSSQVEGVCQWLWMPN